MTRQCDSVKVRIQKIRLAKIVGLLCGLMQVIAASSSHAKDAAFGDPMRSSGSSSLSIEGASFSAGASLNTFSAAGSESFTPVNANPGGSSLSSLGSAGLSNPGSYGLSSLGAAGLAGLGGTGLSPLGESGLSRLGGAGLAALGGSDLTGLAAANPSFSSNSGFGTTSNPASEGIGNISYQAISDSLSTPLILSITEDLGQLQTQATSETTEPAKGAEENKSVESSPEKIALELAVTTAEEMAKQDPAMNPVMNPTMHTDAKNAQMAHAQQVMSPVPEPETYALMLAGLGLLALPRYRRKAARSGATPTRKQSHELGLTTC